MKYLIIAIALFSVSLTFLPEKVNVEFGSYFLKESVWSDESLDIFSDSTFVAHSSSCTYSYDGKGKWSLRNDTLIAIATQSRDERFDKIYKACEPQIFLYLIRKKTIILLEKDNLDTLYKSDVLVKKDPTKKPAKRKKF